MSTSVFCIVGSEHQAQDILTRLKGRGFLGSEVSVLFPDKSGTRDFAHEQNTKAPEGAVTGVGTGGAVGGVLGLLAGIGALAIPGIGPLIAAGPILAALSGAAVGAAVGGLAGALIGMGIPEIEARRYEGKIRDGNILISVHAEDGDEVRAAKDVFEAAGATDIATAREKAAPTSGAGRDAEGPRGRIPDDTGVLRPDVRTGPGINPQY